MLSNTGTNTQGPERFMSPEIKLNILYNEAKEFGQYLNQSWINYRAYMSSAHTNDDQFNFGQTLTVAQARMENLFDNNVELETRLQGRMKGYRLATKTPATPFIEPRSYQSTYWSLMKITQDAIEYMEYIRSERISLDNIRHQQRMEQDKIVDDVWHSMN